MPEPLSVGLMVPINNTTMEPELLAWLPEGSSCRRIGIPRGKAMLTPETLPGLNADVTYIHSQAATGSSVASRSTSCTRSVPGPGPWYMTLSPKLTKSSARARPRRSRA